MSGIWNSKNENSKPYIIQGNWDATLNSPDLSSVTVEGFAWVISVAGNYNLGGITTWNVSDVAIKTTGGWARITPASATWGTITGTLSNQIDIQNAINLKVNNSEAQTIKNVLRNELSSGVKSGFTLSINADNTKFDISGGYGIIIDNTDPKIPLYYEIDIPTGLSSIDVTNLAISNASYIAIDKDLNVIQKTTIFTPTEQRQYIILGAIIHSNRTIINVVNNLPDVSTSVNAQLNDLICGLGNFNISGNIFSANGANLYINKSEGKYFKKGANFINDENNPHILTLSALVAPNTIRYRLQDGTEYPNTDSIDPNNYDVNGVLTPVTANEPYTIQRITIFSSNLVRIQYGQHSYKSQAEAIQNMSTEQFNVEQNIAENGLFRAFLIVARDTTSLQNAVFYEAGRFGISDVSLSGGASTTTLQQAYQNSLKPQIITSTELGSLQVKCGSIANTDTVLEILDSLDNKTVEFKGNGASAFGDISNGNYTEFESQGTIKFNGDASTWVDIDFPIIVRTTGQNIPVPETFQGNLTMNSWAVNNYAVCEVQEMIHSWKEATPFNWHVHIFTNSQDTTDRYVNFEIEFTWANVGETVPANIILTSGDFLIPANTPRLTNFLIPISAYTPIGGKIGAHVKARLRRIASTGLAPSANPFCEMLQIHILQDTTGSRLIGTK